MRKSAAKAASKSSTKSKWVPKGAERKADEAEPESENAEEVITSPLLLEPSTGPSYDRLTMIRFGELIRRRAPAATPAEAKAPEAPTDAEAQEEVKVALEERPAEQEEEEPAPPTRRALREQKKAERLSRRSSSELFEGETEETPTAGAHRIELSQELQPGAYPGGMTPMDAALMTYLHSMAFAAPPMPMYGGIAPGYTTVMLRNIPNRYSRDMLIERLNKSYEGQYDFVYLPIDFNSKCNVGYAFINFRLPTIAQKFIQEFHGAKTRHCLPGFSSAKICEVSYARVQGRDANMDNLRDEKFIEKLTERPEWQPLFYDDQGKEIDFSKTLGIGGGKKRSSRGSGVAPATPQVPMSPAGGYVVPTPYGPMIYPPAPPPTLTNVLPAATSSTMVMLRNVPTSYTRAQMADFLSKRYKGAFDFLFLPGDPKGEGNRGFLFVNFRTPKKAQQFTKDFNGVKLSQCFSIEGADDDKVCEVQSARLQNIERSIERLQTAPPTKGSASSGLWLPLLFAPDGEQAPFPLLISPAGLGAPRVPTTPTPGPLRPVPAKAVDSRTLEMKMRMEATPPHGSAGLAAEVPATPSASSGQKPPPPSPVTPAKAAAAAPATPKSPGAAGGFPGVYPPGYPGGYPGFPQGYPGMQNAALAAAHMSHAAAVMSAAVQQAHLNAHAAAAAHAGLLDPSAAAAQPRPAGQPLSSEKKAALRKQIEFYFSAGNLCKDMYLRSHMDSEGWASLELIAQFPQVRKYKASIAEITEALADSNILEVDSVTHRLRLKDEDERKKWAGAEAAEAAEPKAAG